MALKTIQVNHGEALILSIALQNSPLSVNMRRACSLMKSVSASYWLSGKQTPSSVLCVQSKSFPNLFSIISSHPPLQGGWYVPSPIYLERFGYPGLLAMKFWDPDSASRYNLRVTGGVVMCQCGLYIPCHVSVPHTAFESSLSIYIYFL